MNGHMARSRPRVVCGDAKKRVALSGACIHTRTRYIHSFLDQNSLIAHFAVGEVQLPSISVPYDMDPAMLDSEDPTDR